MNARTPGPWHVGSRTSADGFDPKHGDTFRIWAEDGAAVADISIRRTLDAKGCSPTERANAAFIVEACNSYDTLRAQNAELRRLAREFIGRAVEISTNGAATQDEHLELLEATNPLFAALAKVQKEAQP